MVWHVPHSPFLLEISHRSFADNEDTLHQSQHSQNHHWWSFSVFWNAEAAESLDCAMLHMQMGSVLLKTAKANSRYQKTIFFGHSISVRQCDLHVRGPVRLNKLFQESWHPFVKHGVEHMHSRTGSPRIPSWQNRLSQRSLFRYAAGRQGGKGGSQSRNHEPIFPQIIADHVFS